MASLGQATAKRRRIQPVAVQDDEEPAAPFPPQTLVGDRSQVIQREVPAPEPGRRISIKLFDGYDFNYKKLLSQRGVKFADSSKQAKHLDQAGTVTPAARDLVDALASDRGVQV
jgi:hypothetical protein